jgi:hypothetical protein
VGEIGTHADAQEIAGEGQRREDAALVTLDAVEPRGERDDVAVHGAHQRRAIDEDGVGGAHVAPARDEQRSGDSRRQRQGPDATGPRQRVLAGLRMFIVRSRGGLALSLDLPARHGVGQQAACEDAVHPLPEHQLRQPAAVLEVARWARTVGAGVRPTGGQGEEE